MPNLRTMLAAKHRTKHSFFLGPLKIIFRSSWEDRYPGFHGTAICFDPQTANLPGCTAVEGNMEGNGVSFSVMDRDMEV